MDMTNSVEPILVVEFGTTKSCAALFISPENIVIIPDEHGNTTIPSVISISQNFSRIVGDAKAPNNISNFKRLLGMNSSDKSVPKELDSYQIVANRNIPYVNVPDVGLFSPEHLAAMILTSASTEL